MEELFVDSTMIYSNFQTLSHSGDNLEFLYIFVLLLRTLYCALTLDSCYGHVLYFYS